MDPATHALLGAAVGQAAFGRRLGRQAVVWGALGGLLPDIDIVLAAADPMAELLYHRGPTHSVWFGLVLGTALGSLLWRTRGRRVTGTLTAWIGVMVSALLAHPLLDAFTTYGTQLLAPFSSRRFSLDAVPIIDPLYTLPLLIAVALGWRSRGRGRIAKLSAWGALSLSTGYLGYGVLLNHEAESLARDSLRREGIHAANVHSYPTMFQVYLRRLVAHDGAEVYVGWISLWNGRQVAWEHFTAATGPEVDEVRASREGRIFEWFASEQTAARVERYGSETIVELGDLRYGFPGRPNQPFWGVRARFDGNGRRIGAVRRFRRGIPVPAGELLREMLASAFG